jgi:hypothetical protein
MSDSILVKDLIEKLRKATDDLENGLSYVSSIETGRN